MLSLFSVTKERLRSCLTFRSGSRARALTALAANPAYSRAPRPLPALKALSASTPAARTNMSSACPGDESDMDSAGRCISTPELEAAAPGSTAPEPRTTAATPSTTGDHQTAMDADEGGEGARAAPEPGNAAPEPSNAAPEPPTTAPEPPTAMDADEGGEGARAAPEPSNAEPSNAAAPSSSAGPSSSAATRAAPRSAPVSMSKLVDGLKKNDTIKMKDFPLIEHSEHPARQVNTRDLLARLLGKNASEFMPQFVGAFTKSMRDSFFFTPKMQMDLSAGTGKGGVLLPTTGEGDERPLAAVLAATWSTEEWKDFEKAHSKKSKTEQKRRLVRAIRQSLPATHVCFLPCSQQLNRTCLFHPLYIIQETDAEYEKWKVLAISAFRGRARSPLRIIADSRVDSHTKLPLHPFYPFTGAPYRRGGGAEQRGGGAEQRGGGAEQRGGGRGGAQQPRRRPAVADAADAAADAGRGARGLQLLHVLELQQGRGTRARHSCAAAVLPVAEAFFACGRSRFACGSRSCAAAVGHVAEAFWPVATALAQRPLGLWQKLFGLWQKPFCLCQKPFCLCACDTSLTLPPVFRPPLPLIHHTILDPQSGAAGAAHHTGAASRLRLRQPVRPGCPPHRRPHRLLQRRRHVAVLRRPADGRGLARGLHHGHAVPHRLRPGAGRRPQQPAGLRARAAAADLPEHRRHAERDRPAGGRLAAQQRSGGHGHLLQVDAREGADAARQKRGLLLHQQLADHAGGHEDGALLA